MGEYANRIEENPIALNSDGTPTRCHNKRGHWY